MPRTQGYLTPRGGLAVPVELQMEEVITLPGRLGELGLIELCITPNSAQGGAIASVSVESLASEGWRKGVPLPFLLLSVSNSRDCACALLFKMFEQPSTWSSSLCWAPPTLSLVRASVIENLLQH